MAFSILKPFLPYIFGALACLGLVIGILFYGNQQYDTGYATAKTEAALEMQTLKADLEKKKNEEIQRQIAANQRAQENAAKRIQQIETEKTALERLLEDNEREADADQNSNRVGLDAPSVLRLNKIK